MTKLASKIATSLAVLALAGPALAVNKSSPEGSGTPATTQAPARHHRAHKKVAQADKAAEGKSTESKGADAKSADAKAKRAEKKHKHKAHEKSAAKSDAAPAPAPAPAK